MTGITVTVHIDSGDDTRTEVIKLHCWQQSSMPFHELPRELLEKLLERALKNAEVDTKHRLEVIKGD